jgi:hypothetical protein
VEPGASPDDAAAAAVHYLLARMYPDQANEMEKGFQASLDAVTEGAPKAEGIRLGEQTAIAILAERSTDGADAPNT